MQDRSPTQQVDPSESSEQTNPVNQPQQFSQAAQQSQSVANSEIQPELNIEQCRSQLRQKIKENKILQTKNKKLQTKYIELFKQQKLLKKDYNVLTAIVKEIFPEIGEKSMGKYDLEEIRDLWKIRETKWVDRVQELENDMDKFKEKTERQSNQLAEEKINKALRQAKQKVDNINKELDSFKKNSKTLGQQLGEYDKKLQSKNDEVSKLTKQKLKLEHMLNHLKMKSITDELAQKTEQEENKTISQRNQLLALRHQVSELMIKRDELRSELKSSKSTVQKYKQIVQQKNQQILKLTQHKQSKQQKPSPIVAPESKPRSEEQPQQIKLQTKISINSSEGKSQQQHPQHHLIGDDQYIHREYMKNVFIRYMKSWAKGENSEKQVLLNIILTMLKFNTKEKEMILEKKKNWWIY